MKKPDIQPLTFEQSKKLCSGAIHSTFSTIKFVDSDGKVADERLSIVLSRQSPNGTEVRFAGIYKHPCGSVVMHTDDCSSVSLKTLEEDVIPKMRKFEKIVALHDPQLPSSLDSIARSMDIPGIGCSKGGCKVCNPARKAFKEANKQVKNVNRA